MEGAPLTNIFISQNAVELRWFKRTTAASGIYRDAISVVLKEQFCEDRCSYRHYLQNWSLSFPGSPVWIGFLE